MILNMIKSERWPFFFAIVISHTLTKSFSQILYFIQDFFSFCRIINDVENSVHLNFQSCKNIARENFINEYA